MSNAWAVIQKNRIAVYTEARTSEEFSRLLTACKAVRGGRFDATEGDKHWHYPLSVDTCLELREAFGPTLKVHTGLANWYRQHAAVSAERAALAAQSDAPLPVLTAAYPAFARWLRGYQRTGAAWMAQPYRNAGLVADQPGLGKTAQALAALVESGLQGPVVVVCPKASVRLVWGRALRERLPDVPAYLCYGSRGRRQKELERFAADVSRDPAALRVVVVVAEMLRVNLGDPCYTAGGRRVSGMCPQRLLLPYGVCTLHEQRPAQKEKDRVPVSFSYPILFDASALGGGWAAIILDESQKLLGSLNVVKGNLMGRGLKYLPERTGRRYALSGTPFGKAGRVIGLFGTLHWLWPDEYTSYWRWVGQNFHVEEKVVNRRGLTVREIGNLKGLDPTASPEEQAAAWERFLRTLGPRVLRRTKQEKLPGLPPKDVKGVVCGMTKRQGRQYAELMKFAEVMTPGGPVTVNGSLALLTRSRQIANGEITRDADGQVHFSGQHSGKMNRLWQALETRGILDGATGPKLAIASAFNEFLDVIAARLYAAEVPFYRYDGRLTQAVRDTVVECWQANTPTPQRTWAAEWGAVGVVPRVLLLNATAGGVSIDLDAGDELHAMDELPDPGANEQLEDRFHRASRNHQVTIYYYRTEGTIDYKRAEDVEFRRRSQHALIDGSRGVEDLRALMAEAFAETEIDDD